MSTYTEHLIVGAGISGLTLYHELKKKGQDAIIIEKSKAIGGRIATRRDGEATYDHGAQFYHHDGEFYNYWSQALMPLEKKWIEHNSKNYFSIPKGFTTFSKSIANGIQLQLETKLLSLQKIDETFIANCENNVSYHSPNVYLTSPVAQSIEILKASSIMYPKTLDSVVYAKALVLLVELNTPLDFDYQENISKEIFSASNQTSKGVSKKINYTFVMSPSWSDEYFEKKENLTKEAAMDLVRSAFSVENIVTYQLKKWRYSHPLQAYPQPYLQLSIAPHLFLLGDGFGGPSLNGAVKSAVAVIKSQKL